MTARSYSDLSDSATTFDPEEQFDRDIDERMKGMSKEEAAPMDSPHIEEAHLLELRGIFKGMGDPPFKAGDALGNSDGNFWQQVAVADELRSLAIALGFSSASG
jgi:hypothetical protein